MSNCAECATAARLPHLYRVACIGCMVRAINDIPESLPHIRERAAAEFERDLLPDDRERFRSALQVAGTAT